MDELTDIKDVCAIIAEQEYQIQTQRQSNMGLTFRRAYQSITQYPGVIQHPNQLTYLKFIGDKVSAIIALRLKKYCTENGMNFPSDEYKDKPLGFGDSDDDEPPKTRKRANSTKKSTTDGEKAVPKKRKTDLRTGSNKDGDNAASTTTKKRTTKQYIPKIKSGGYAIMLVLLKHDPDSNGMIKDDITRLGIRYCDNGFTSNAPTGQFYSAWNSIKTLMDKDYVKQTGRPAHYLLTETGIEVAKRMRKIHDEMIAQERAGVNSSPLRSANETINNVRVDSAVISSSPVSASILNKQKYDGVDYSIWEPGSYEVIPMIDNREIKSQQDRNFFKQQLGTLGIDNIIRDLPVGDGIWVAKHKKTGTLAVLDFIYERKRLDDFADSIKDGRFREQKLRLTRTGLKRIYYVVEEIMGSDVSRFGEALQTCMSMNITYSDIHIRRTKDTDDTLQLIIKMTASIRRYYKHKKLVVIEPRNLHAQTDYAVTLDKFRAKFNGSGFENVYSYSTFHDILGKTSMISVKELFLKMLLTIRGISLDKAVVIQQRFRTPKMLIRAYENYGGEKSKMITEIFKDEVGVRKIGPALSRKVFEAWGDARS